MKDQDMYPLQIILRDILVMNSVSSDMTVNISEMILKQGLAGLVFISSTTEGFPTTTFRTFSPPACVPSASAPSSVPASASEVPSCGASSCHEKIAMMLAGGELPDVFLNCGITAAQMTQYGVEDQYLIPLDDLIDQYAPNLMADCVYQPLVSPLRGTSSFMPLPLGSLSLKAINIYLYAEGLMDAGTLTQTNDQLKKLVDNPDAPLVGNRD